MKLFVNGDSHTAQVYPEGLTATYQLAQRYGLEYENIALPGGSNQRIIRTTQEKLKELDPKDTIIIIGWSDFARTEYFYKNQWHQICGDFEYQVDAELDNVRKERIDQYRDRGWDESAEQHNQIWVFHQLLNNLGYRHLFYQGCKTFFFDGCPEQDMEFKHSWSNCWVHVPYVTLTKNNERIIENFSQYAENHGCNTTDHRAHFGQDAHDLWRDYLDKYIKKSGIL